MLKDSEYIKDLRERKYQSNGMSCNDCFKPSASATKADLREYHREEMPLRRKRQERRVTHAMEQVAKLKAKGTLQAALANFSRTPKGRKRTDTMIRIEIWPQGKVARPGRMG